MKIKITERTTANEAAQPDRPSEIQDILDYLDTVLHPIISPEHWNVYSELHDMISTLPSAQPEQQHERIFQEIVVEYPSISTYPEYIGKPYFSIKYVEDGHYFIGYGTYNPEVLSEYLKEYFMPSAQPNIIRCGECRHLHDNDCPVVGWGRDDDDYCAWAERDNDE